MPYTWEEARQAIERHEDAQLTRFLAEREITEGHVVRPFFLVQRTRPLFEMLGGVVIGLHAAVLTLVFNYLLFIWIMHVNFDS